MGALKARSNLDRSLYRVPLAVQRTYLRIARTFAYVGGFGLALAAFGTINQTGWVEATGYLLAALGAFYAIQCWALIKVLSGKRLDVSNDLITFDQGNGKVDIYPIAEIEHVRLIWIPFVFSRLVLHMKDGRTLRFANAMWERFDYVLDVVAHAHPDLTSFPRYARFRNQCIAFDHTRSRMAESMTLASFYELFAKAIATPVIAGAIILMLKAAGIGHGYFPSNQWIFANTFVIVGLLWPLVLAMSDFMLFRATMSRLEQDSDDVRRDRIAEAKFNHTYGIHSWFAFASLIALTCLMCAIRLN